MMVGGFGRRRCTHTWPPLNPSKSPPGRHHQRDARTHELTVCSWIILDPAAHVCVLAGHPRNTNAPSEEETVQWLVHDTEITQYQISQALKSYSFETYGASMKYESREFFKEWSAESHFTTGEAENILGPLHRSILLACRPYQRLPPNLACRHRWNSPLPPCPIRRQWCDVMSITVVNAGDRPATLLIRSISNLQLDGFGLMLQCAAYCWCRQNFRCWCHRCWSFRGPLSSPSWARPSLAQADLGQGRAGPGRLRPSVGARRWRPEGRESELLKGVPSRVEASKADGLKGEGGQKGGWRDRSVGSHTGRGEKGGGQQFRLFLLVFFFSHLDVLFFLRQSGRVPFRLKGIHKMNEELQICIFGSPIFWREGNKNKKLDGRKKKKPCVGRSKEGRSSVLFVEWLGCRLGVGWWLVGGCGLLFGETSERDIWKSRVPLVGFIFGPKSESHLQEALISVEARKPKRRTLFDRRLFWWEVEKRNPEQASFQCKVGKEGYLDMTSFSPALVPTLPPHLPTRIPYTTTTPQPLPKEG